jgi:hypothetical protein
MSDVSNLTAISESDVTITRSVAGRLLQSHRRKRAPEDLRVRVGIDLRSKAGRAARELKAALLRHVGRRPTGAQIAMIEQLIQLKLRLAIMDQHFVASGFLHNMHDSRQYLAWSNSFTRGLRLLGLDGISEAPITLAEALAAGAPQATLAGSATTPLGNVSGARSNPSPADPSPADAP